MIKKILFLGFTLWFLIEISYIWQALVNDDEFALSLLPTSLAIVALYIIVLLIIGIRSQTKKK